MDFTILPGWILQVEMRNKGAWFAGCFWLQFATVFGIPHTSRRCQTTNRGGWVLAWKQGWGWDCSSLKALSLRLEMMSCFSGFARWWHAEYYSLGFLHWRSRFAFLHGNRPLHQLLGFDKGLERGMGRNQEELGIKIKKALWELRKKMHGSSLAILLFRRPWEGIFLGLSDAIS